MFDFLKRLMENIEKRREQGRLEEGGWVEAKKEQERREHERLKQQQRDVAKKRKCPYCSAIIDKEPKGKFKCPSCKSDIYIQKSGTEVNLLTKDERERLNAERKKRAEKNKNFRFFEDIVDDRDFLEKKRVEYLQKFECKGNYDDLTWWVANEVQIAFVRKNDFHNAGMVYIRQAMFQYERGKPFFHLLQEYQRMVLYDIKYRLPEFNMEVNIVTSGNKSCPPCRENGLRWMKPLNKCLSQSKTALLMGGGGAGVGMPQKLHENNQHTKSPRS